MKTEDHQLTKMILQMVSIQFTVKAVVLLAFTAYIEKFIHN